MKAAPRSSPTLPHKKRNDNVDDDVNVERKNSFVKEKKKKKIVKMFWADRCTMLSHNTYDLQPLIRFNICSNFSMCMCMR